MCAVVFMDHDAMFISIREKCNHKQRTMVVL